MLLLEKPSVEGRLATVGMYIRAHLDERLTLEGIGAIAGFSPSHFHRIFRVAFGENLNAYVVRHRMMRAAHELRSGDRSIIEIALRCGYESHSAFSRAFTRAFGTAPNAYRSARDMPARVPLDGVPSATKIPQPRIEEYPAREALAIRFVGPYDEVDPVLRRLSDVARHRGFLPASSILGLSYGSPDLQEHNSLCFDACVTTTPGADIAGARADGLHRIELLGGRHAVFLHRGSYDRITHAYDALVAAWILSGRIELRNAPFINTYLSDPAITRDRDLECELAIPIH